MFSLFKKTPLLSEKDFNFQLETYKWLLKNFGGDSFYHKAKLVLPTKTFFPDKVSEPKEVAESTFERVKEYAGLEKWPCQLMAQDTDIDPVISPTMILQNAPSSPNGTFRVDESQEIMITYNPSLLRQPALLVATFAHELAHYLTATSIDEPPGGWENWEFATDITATFLGFGIFMCNASFNFSQYSQADSMGWQSSRSGYLSESEHCMALALFLLLKNIPIENTHRYLKPHLRKYLKRATREIINKGSLTHLRDVKYRYKL